MRVIRSIPEVRTALAPHRRGDRTIGLIPTMGALHEGHLSLVRSARAASDVVVVSIFVNPLQFGPAEDLDTYPRDEERDLKLLESEGVDIAFVPTVGEMYRSGQATSVHVSGLTDELEGAYRPGHFDGVCTVVSKLFNIVRPHSAYFGQKDAQQVVALQRMVADLDFAVELKVLTTVREPDGLALSSRNAYLSEDERKAATVLYRALREGRSVLVAGGTPSQAGSAMAGVFASVPGVSVDYAVVRDRDDLGPPKDGAPCLLLVAARVGSTRLIDNMVFDPKER